MSHQRIWLFYHGQFSQEAFRAVGVEILAYSFQQISCHLLYNGITFATFHSSGKMPDCNEQLKRCVMKKKKKDSLPLEFHRLLFYILDIYMQLIVSGKEECVFF